MICAPKTSNLTVERLKELLSYGEATGVFRWKVGGHSRRVVGGVAGSRMATGYIEIGIDGSRYLGHRLAWLYVHGRMPTKCVDHADGVRHNNAIANLREADHANNAWNTEHRGWSIDARYSVKKYRAEISVRGKRLCLGYHSTPEAAREAYLAATIRHFGDFSSVHREKVS